MFCKIIEEFKDIIYDFEIKNYKRFGRAKALVAKIEFIDKSVLYVRDYTFLSGERKYSYHWQDREGNLLIRWDNSPHHLQVETFPHHKHVGDKIVKSTEITLPLIMEVIKDTI